jgi:hypothetical protein
MNYLSLSEQPTSWSYVGLWAGRREEIRNAVSGWICFLKSITDTQCQSYSILVCFFNNSHYETVNTEYKWDLKLFNTLLVCIIYKYVVIKKRYNMLKFMGRCARSKKFFFLWLTCHRMHSNKHFFVFVFTVYASGVMYYHGSVRIKLLYSYRSTMKTLR